jgi:uncharacterized membrane protein
VLDPGRRRLHPSAVSGLEERVLSTYTALKSLHVLFAITWVGSGIFIQFYATTAIHDGDPVEVGTFAKRIAQLGMRMITPASLVVLLLGILMVAQSPVWNFSDTWIELGLLGYLITALTGIFFIGPESGRISKLVDEQGPAAPEPQRRSKRIFLVSRIDLLVIVLVVFDMVIKPGT